jgi:hypothetical protein
VGVQWYSELRVHLAPVSGARQATVTGKRPAETRLPRLAGDLTSQAREANEEFQERSCRFRAGGLIIQLQDWNKGRSLDKLPQVLYRKEHGNNINKGSDKSDDDSSDDGKWDVALWMRDFLGQMSGRIPVMISTASFQDAVEPIQYVQAREGPVGVDKSNNEGNSTGFPTGVVYKVCKDELCILLRRRLGEHSDRDDYERHQRHIEEKVPEERQSLAVAVEEVRKEVEDLVCNKHHPPLNISKASLLAYNTRCRADIFQILTGLGCSTESCP